MLSTLDLMKEAAPNNEVTRPCVGAKFTLSGGDDWYETEYLA
jgi:hypothetical protein